MLAKSQFVAMASKSINKIFKRVGVTQTSHIITTAEC